MKMNPTWGVNYMNLLFFLQQKKNQTLNFTLLC